MKNINDLIYAPFSYGLIWLWLAIISLLMITGILIVIFYITRKKTIKSLRTLDILQPRTIDVESLRNKYLKLIDESEQQFDTGKIKSSVCHQQLSILVRLFYYETMGFHAEVLTLDDLKKTNYPQLVKLIGEYYPDEFNTLEEGAAGQAAENARELVRSQ